MESPHGDPTTPGVAPATACACPTAWADEVHRAGQICRKTGRQGGQPDTLSGTGRTQAAPDLASLAPTAYPSYPACLHCPVSRYTHVCHIVNASVTRAPLKTAFCQAILLFSNLSKRYALIHNNLRDN